MAPKRFAVALFVVGALVCAPVPVSADLIGHRMALSATYLGYDYGPYWNTNEAIVGDPGVEFISDWGSLVISLDVAQNTLKIDYTPGYYWVIGMSYWLEDLTPGMSFTGIELLSNHIAESTNPGTPPVTLAYGVSGNKIHVEVPNHMSYEGLAQSAEFRLDYNEGPPVPEPGSIVLFGTGLVCAARAWRRRRC